jgi:hypothetical protein
MKRTHTLVAVVLLVLAGPAVLAQPPKQSQPDPAEWVPAHAIFYLGISDTARLVTDAQKTVAYQSFTDADLQSGPFDWSAAAKSLKARLATVMNTTPDALENPFAGPLALYVTAPPGARLDDSEVVLIAGVGSAELMRRYVDTAVGRLKETADRYEGVSAGGETVHLFTKRKAATTDTQEDEFDFDDAADEGPFGLGGGVEALLDELMDPENLPDTLALCLTAERLIMAQSVDRVRAVLTPAGGGETLADTDDHRTLLNKLKPVGQVRVVLNVPRLLEMARADATDQAGVQQFMRFLGAGSLRSIVGHARIGVKSYDSKFELLCLMQGERTGLAKLLSQENRPIAPPRWVSAESFAYMSLNLDPPRFLDDVLRMLADSDPDTATTFRMTLEEGMPLPDGQQINWRKDIINNLAGPLVASAGATRPIGAGCLRGLVTLGHRNRDALMRAMTGVTQMFGGAPPRDYRGTQVFSDPTGGEMAVTADRLLYGNKSAVEAALTATEAAGLAEDANFGRARRHVPEEAWCVVYFDGRRMIETMVELAKKGAELDPMSAESGIPMLFQMGGMDFSDTAKSQKMTKYAAPSILTIAQTPDGVLMTAVGLRPDEQE